MKPQPNSRLDQLVELASTWSGPMSIAVFAPAQVFHNNLLTQNISCAWFAAFIMDCLRSFPWPNDMWTTCEGARERSPSKSPSTLSTPSTIHPNLLQMIWLVSYSIQSWGKEVKTNLAGWSKHGLFVPKVGATSLASHQT